MFASRGHYVGKPLHVKVHKGISKRILPCSGLQPTGRKYRRFQRRTPSLRQNLDGGDKPAANGRMVWKRRRQHAGRCENDGVRLTKVNRRVNKTTVSSLRKKRTLSPEYATSLLTLQQCLFYGLLICCLIYMSYSEYSCFVRNGNV